MKQIIFLLFLLSCTAVYAQQQDSVTIHGRVTDYNGQPIDSASVWWQNPQFNDIIEAITDKDGHYTARIPKGKYQSAASIYLPSYAHIAMKSGLPETEHRLEFWAWDFIADRDTTLDIRYHRMEAYGLRAFCIPGAMPTYQIYVRPMSLTRTYQWMKETKPESLVHGENLSDIEQQEQNKEARECQMAPRPGQLKVPNIFNFHAPQADLPDYVAWKPLTQENVMNFSALGYFFAKAMYEKNSIPVGLINSSWGGTPVEAWISEEGLKEFPKYINDKRQYEDDAYLKSIKQTEGLSFYRWNTSLYRGDAGLHEATPWYAANYNDKDWKTVDLFSTDWGTNGLNPINGSHWFRKEVEVPQDWNGKEATLRLGCIVDADSVYVNGTFVGTVSYQYPPRIYTIPAGVLKAGKNTVTIRLISNNGYPHFVKEKPYKIICGNEEVSLQGEWKYRLGASMPPAPGMMFFCYKPVCLYNAMIAPLQNYGIRGVLWYQGESNVDRRNEYAALLTVLIADWRSTFDNPELPFYIIELADFLSKDDISGRQAWAEMRKEQAKVAETNRNTRLIRNSDLGEWNDIHPLDKKTLGQRAAESALETDNK